MATTGNLIDLGHCQYQYWKIKDASALPGSHINRNARTKSEPSVMDTPNRGNNIETLIKVQMNMIPAMGKYNWRSKILENIGGAFP